MHLKIEVIGEIAKNFVIKLPFCGNNMSAG
jgi:hypothetical protein